MCLVTLALRPCQTVVFNNRCAGDFSFFSSTKNSSICLTFFSHLVLMLSSTMAATLRTQISGLLWNIVELALFQT